MNSGLVMGKWGGFIWGVILWWVWLNGWLIFLGKVCKCGLVCWCMVGGWVGDVWWKVLGKWEMLVIEWGFEWDVGGFWVGVVDGDGGDGGW